MPPHAAMHQVAAWDGEDQCARCPVLAEHEQCLPSRVPCMGSLRWGIVGGQLTQTSRKLPLVYGADWPVQAYLQGLQGCGPLPTAHASLLGLPGED